MPKRERCGDCGVRPKKAHVNAKWCARCADRRKANPSHALTASQIRKALSLRGKMRRHLVAECVGCTVSAISRLGREKKLSFSAMPYATNPDLVRRIVAHYRAFGGPATLDKFGKMANLRSVVERYSPEPGPHRIARWTNKQVVELARMGGLVSFEAQARYFNRPNAYAGSINAFWQNRVGVGPGQIHGMSVRIAQQLCQQPFKATIVSGSEGSSADTRRLVLWVDAVKCLRGDIPDFMREAIEVMAGFQHWLFKTDNPRAAILRLIRTRSKQGLSDA